MFFNAFWGSSIIYSKLAFGTLHISMTSDLICHTCLTLPAPWWANARTWPRQTFQDDSSCAKGLLLRTSSHDIAIAGQHQKIWRGTKTVAFQKTLGQREEPFPHPQGLSPGTRLPMLSFDFAKGMLLSANMLLWTRTAKQNAGLNLCNAFRMPQDHL